MISVFGSKVGKEELGQVAESINNQWLGMGPKVKEFEHKFAKRLGLNKFLMVDSGSNALYLAVKLLNLPAGSETISKCITKNTKAIVANYNEEWAEENFKYFIDNAN